MLGYPQMHLREKSAIFIYIFIFTVVVVRKVVVSAGQNQLF